MASDFCFVYMTAGSVDEARMIGEVLVAERLAACVNMIEGMTSIYRWEDEIRRDAEIVMIAKTTKDQVDPLSERVRTLHSYECPCIVALPVEGGNQAFLNWINEQIKGR